MLYFMFVSLSRYRIIRTLAYQNVLKLKREVLFQHLLISFVGTKGDRK